MDKKIKHHLVVILDKSGSMNSIADQAVTTFNEQVQTARARSKDFDIVVTLVTFNYDIYFERVAESIDKVKDLARHEYMPNGNTALNDAVAAAIDKTKEWIEKQNEKVDVLICIISDGEENASRKYPRIGNKDLAEIVQTMQQKHGWSFVFSGTNDYDLSKTAVAMNIPAGNVTSFKRSDSGVKQFASTYTAATDHYYGMRSSQRSLGDAQIASSIDCFYSDTTLDDTLNGENPDKNLPKSNDLKEKK